MFKFNKFPCVLQLAESDCGAVIGEIIFNMFLSQHYYRITANVNLLSHNLKTKTLPGKPAPWLSKLI